MKGVIILVALCLAYRALSEQYDIDVPEFTIRQVAVGEPFIINGREAVWGEFPWQLSFELPTYEIDGSDGHFCGASLLSERWALTAGHCIILPAGATRVLGNVITRSVDRLTTGQLVNLTVHYRHELYDNDTTISYSNDIALLEFENPIQNYYEQFAPINLPEAGADFVGSQCEFSGWGTITGPLGLPQDTLQAAHTSVITNEECQTMVEGIGGVGPGHICIYNGETGACSGDSGGPLACKNQYDNWVLAGVTSWGVVGVANNRTYCSIEHPTAYTRVSYYLDWISQITNGELPKRR